MVSSLGFRGTRAPRRVGLFLFISFPAIQSSSGGWTRSPWRVRAPRRVGLYLFPFQPSRVSLEGGLAHLGESARHGALAFIYFFSSHPEFLWRVDLLTLASPRATARWPLSISFPAIQSSSGGWTRSPWRVRVPWHIGLSFSISFPAFQRSSGRWACSLGESVCHGALAFIYFVPSLPEYLWKVGLLAWYVCTLQCIGCATRCWPLCVYFHLSQGCSSGTPALRSCYPA